MCVLSKTAYLVAFRVAAASAAEPAFVAESSMYDSAIIIIIIIIIIHASKPNETITHHKCTTVPIANNTIIVDAYVHDV